jgi:predicted peptidase
MNRAIVSAAMLCTFSAAAQPTDPFTTHYEYATFIQSGDTLLYRVMWPENYDPGKTYPLVVFLHGRGESGTNNESQLTHGANLFIQSRKAFPAIVVFPQCPSDDYWPVAEIEQLEDGRKFSFPLREIPNPSLGMVSQLIDQLVLKKPVDPSRIYVAGLSMGAMGTYELVSRKPDTFAAAIAICGGGNEAAAKTYAKNTPFWIFHGLADDVVPPAHSIAMEKALRNAGGDPKLTLYENVNHNSWDRAFAEPDLLKWLFSNSK